MKHRKDTYVYRLINGNETVFVGKTNNPEATHQSHVNKRQTFTAMELIGFPTSAAKANILEREALHHFARKQGKLPRYNHATLVTAEKAKAGRRTHNKPPATE